MRVFGPYYDLGEFIFGYLDLADLAFPPILAAVENYPGVQPYEVVGPLPAAPGTNYPVGQELPVCLARSTERSRQRVSPPDRHQCGLFRSCR